MPRPRLFTAPLLFCFAANFFQGVAFNLFLHFPGFLDDLGADALEVGWISGVAALTAIGVRPKVGDWMDRRGRRGIILLGGFVNVAVLGLYLLVTTIGPLLVGVRILHGLAEALLFTSLFTYAADQVPKDRLTEGLALFGVSGMLPISVGGLLGDAILGRAGYDALFGVALSLSVVSLLLSLPLRDAVRERSSEDGLPRGFTAVALQRDLLPLWWIAGMFTMALAGMFTFLKLFVEETGIGTVGGFFTTYTAIALAMRVFFGWLPDRVGPKRVLFPALSALAAGFGVLAVAQSASTVAVAGLLCGFGHGYAFPVLFGMVVTRTREADRGSAMALYTGLFDVGVLVGAPALGFVIDHAGYPAMFTCAAGLVIVGVVGFAIWDRGRR